MGILLIVMLFAAMVFLGLWERRRSRKRYEQASSLLRNLYNEMDEHPEDAPLQKLPGGEKE